MIWKCGTSAVNLDRPVIMGILNVTPDSFSDGGKWLDAKSALKCAERLLADGAAIIDVGGESTRPHATPVAEEEEWNRIKNVVGPLCAVGAIVSVDTYHPGTAKRALDAGASAINCVKPAESVPEIVDAVAQYGAGLVLMHSRESEPATSSFGIVDEVEAFLQKEKDFAVSRGVAVDALAVDPGVGFGKTRQEDVMLLGSYARLSKLGPSVVACSRKRVVGMLSGIENAAGRDGASAAIALSCAFCGARILRVHNVRAVKKLLDACLNDNFAGHKMEAE